MSEENEEDRLDPGEEAQFDRLPEYLHRARGFDFTGYKRESLSRRKSLLRRARGARRGIPVRHEIVVLGHVEDCGCGSTP